MIRRGAYLIFIAIFSLTINACASKQTPPSVLTDVPIVPAQTAGLVPTQAPDSQPQTPIYQDGALIYDDSENILAVDPTTGKTQMLVSRKELEFMLGADRSAESSTYGSAVPIKIRLSPDLKKALVSPCLSLDDRLRCLNENFIYSLEEKSIVPLPNPAGVFGFYWAWSPDGTKLGGAGWMFNGAAYEIARFYMVNSDGTDLKVLESVTNEHWQTVWAPNSAALLPMTFVTNFRSMLADGSEQSIAINSLEWDDKFQCLAFSPDGAQAAFIVRRDQPKDHDRLYIAKADFSGLSLLSEYDMPSDHYCAVAWSPDQAFIHIRYGSDPRAEFGQAEQLAVVDKVFRAASGESVAIPENAEVCGWTPASDLLYESPNGLTMLGLAANAAALPDALQSALGHCPQQWVKDPPVWNIPLGLSVSNACHPGNQTEEKAEPERFPPVFDLVRASSSLEGETLSVTMTLSAVEKDLNVYLTPGVDNFLNGWDVFVDVDNNALTGDQFGVEYRLSIAVRPGSDGNPPAIGSAILKYDPVSKKYSNSGKLDYSLNADATLKLKGTVPGLTENSRLLFLSRLVDKASNSVIGDRICN